VTESSVEPPSRIGVAVGAGATVISGG
jgi:hypothetical protein